MEIARLAQLGVVEEAEVGHEAYKGRLSIPYITKTGVVDLRFRALHLLRPYQVLRQQDLPEGHQAKAIANRQREIYEVCSGQEQLPHAENHDHQNLAGSVPRIHVRPDAVDSTDHPPHPTASKG